MPLTDSLSGLPSGSCASTTIVAALSVRRRCDTPVRIPSFLAGAISILLRSVVLIDGLRLADLMSRYRVGVQVKRIYDVVEIDEDYFESFGAAVYAERGSVRQWWADLHR